MSERRWRSALPWVGLAGLAFWVGLSGTAPLAVAALGFGGGLIGRELAPRLRIALACGVLAVVAGFFVEGRGHQVRVQGESLREAREERVYRELAHELDRLLRRSQDAIASLARTAEDGNGATIDDLRALRRAGDFDGVAIFDADGQLRIWDGEHRGRIPEDVRSGARSFAFGDLPLARHVYATGRLSDGGTVMVSTLLQADLPDPIRSERGDFARRFGDRTGERLDIVRPDRVPLGVAPFAEMVWEGEQLFAVLLDRPSDAERLERIRGFGRRMGLVLVFLVWALLVSATPGTGARRRAAGASLVGLTLVLPPEVIPGLAGVADPGGLLLPGGVTLGRLALLIAGALIASGLGPTLPVRLRLPSWGAAALLGAGAFGLPWLFRTSASIGLLTTGEAGWIVYTLTLGGGLALFFWAALASARRMSPSWSRVAGAVGVAGALGVAGAVWAVAAPGLPAGLAVAWILPVLWVRGRLPHPGPGRAGLLTVLLAAVLGMSLALPVAWGDRIEARRAEAETRIARLGTGPNPYLEFLLHRMGEGLERLDAVGARPVELLYEGWRESGLAEAGYPVWLTLWSPGGLPEEDLPVGTDLRARPGVADAYLDDAIAGDTIAVRRFQLADAHYVVEVPLRGGWVVTGVVPPLRSLGATTLLGPLFGGFDEPAEDPLTLVPILSSEEVDEVGELRWIRSENGWRGQITLAYPGARYAARYDVPIPGLLVTGARAGLLLFLALGGAAALWLVGRGLQGLFQARWAVRIGPLRSFRARITLALFAFFAVSNLGFGTLAYRTIAGASERAAEVLAARVIQEAESIYFEVQGQIDFLAQQVGSELLEYRDGALREGSLDPLVELGLYQGWVPYDVDTQLTGLEVVQATRRTTVGGGAYVTAWRRLPDGDVIAAPVPLQAGAAAVRAREVVHLLAFAMIGGALLSLVLALLTGRALAQPIQTLRVASERVGSGNLSLRLPEGREDEFGRVFDAFNRMVQRLQRARTSLLRTTQRTRAIVEDSATGVVALDGEGRVSLVNPRALELLGGELREEEAIGDILRRVGDDGSREVLDWIRRYQVEGPREASADLQFGGRRLRVRGRRITREGPTEGVVVNLEDVTDELRAERVIAWGEMARQVAHEVKNPLTPIKLSIQHIRRAWADRRPDFETILTRNADAMLKEIDRLAEIASGFSRFGTPGDAADALEPVDLERVVQDVLALYGGPEGGVRFEGRIEEPLPPVQARAAEVKEVLVNLLENARAAVTGTGLVTIHAFETERGIRLQVVDDGSGIPEEILGRIFEPQFSTRSTGTGLGLAIVRRLVERWGGTVTARSRVGEGSSFHIDFRVWGRG